eukprot:g28862.t1
MCDPTSDLYHRFEVRLGHHRFLDPIQDLCTENHRWWKEDACPRSVVETLAPLFLVKMLQRAFLQPVIVLFLWKLSTEVNGELHVFPLAFLGIRRWRICTSKRLDRGSQASLLVTLAEVVIVWSPLVGNRFMSDADPLSIASSLCHVDLYATFLSEGKNA